jgi:hypothetical protein
MHQKELLKMTIKKLMLRLEELNKMVKFIKDQELKWKELKN